VDPTQAQVQPPTKQFAAVAQVLTADIAIAITIAIATSIWASSLSVSISCAYLSNHLFVFLSFPLNNAAES